MVDVSVFIELGKEKPNGFSNDDIRKKVPGVKNEDIVAAINKCSKAGTIEFLGTRKDKFFYKYKDLSQLASTKGLDNEERIVFQIIETAGTKGIWIRDIRFQSNISEAQLKKILKRLETNKIIKTVQSVEAPRKKVYMLYNLVPDNTITGGAWYQDQDFELEFVDILNQQCLRFLIEKAGSTKITDPLLVQKIGYATVEEVHKFISELKIGKISLSVKDIESILYTLVLDNKAERIFSSGTFMYKAANDLLLTSGIVKQPCHMCPVEERCSKDGKINPTLCEYLTGWLDF